MGLLEFVSRRDLDDQRGDQSWPLLRRYKILAVVMKRGSVACDI